MKNCIFCAVEDHLTGFYIMVALALHDPERTIKFSIEDFFSKCYQIRWKLQIWSHLLKKQLMESFIFCAVWVESTKFRISESDR